MSAEEQSSEGQHSIPMEGEDIMPKKDGGVLKEPPVMKGIKEGTLFEEIKFHLLNPKSYHPCTSSHAHPESRKSCIRRYSKTYKMKGDKLYYRHQGKLRLVLFTKEEVSMALKECHDNLGTGGHPGVSRTTEKVTMSYHWEHLRADVKQWVDECPRCQHHAPRPPCTKTLAPVLHPIHVKEAPVLHPIHVKEAWSVLGVDLIGPLPTTSKGKRFILTATDLFTKWVVAKSLYSKTAPEVSRKIVNILMDFGLVQRIITNQGREFVNELNRGVFEALGVKHCVTAYHPQANGQGQCTNKNIKDALAKYVGEDQNDWDVHIRGIVAAINTSKQRSTKYTPYCALFGRHPRVPGIINATEVTEQADDENPVCVDDVTEEHLESETKAKDIADMHAKAKLIGHKTDRLKKRLLAEHAYAMEEELQIKKSMLELMEESSRRSADNMLQINTNIASITSTVQDGLSLMRDYLSNLKLHPPPTVAVAEVDKDNYSPTVMHNPHHPTTSQDHSQEFQPITPQGPLFNNNGNVTRRSDMVVVRFP